MTSTTKFDLNSLLPQYEVFAALDRDTRSSYVKKNWLTTTGSVLLKTLWTRFLYGFCFTRRSFKSENCLSLKQTERKLTESFTSDSSLSDVLKVAKGIFVLESFKVHKYDKNPKKAVKHSISEATLMQIDMTILLLSQLQTAINSINEKKEIVVPLLRDQLRGNIQHLKDSVARIEKDMTNLYLKYNRPQKAPSLALINKFTAMNLSQ